MGQIADPSFDLVNQARATELSITSHALSQG